MFLWGVFDISIFMFIGILSEQLIWSVFHHLESPRVFLHCFRYLQSFYIILSLSSFGTAFWGKENKFYQLFCKTPEIFPSLSGPTDRAGHMTIVHPTPGGPWRPKPSSVEKSNGANIIIS